MELGDWNSRFMPMEIKIEGYTPSGKVLARLFPVDRPADENLLVLKFAVGPS